MEMSEEYVQGNIVRDTCPNLNAGLHVEIQQKMCRR